MNYAKYIWYVLVEQCKVLWALFLKWFTPVVEEIKDIARAVDAKDEPKLKTKIKLRKKVKKASKKSKK